MQSIFSVQLVFQTYRFSKKLSYLNNFQFIVSSISDLFTYWGSIYLDLLPLHATKYTFGNITFDLIPMSDLSNIFLTYTL